MRRGEPPDIVPDADDATLREIYGPDADEIIAFKRFLALPTSEPSDEFPRGQVQCPPHFYDYVMGKISGKELVARDDVEAAK